MTAIEESGWLPTLESAAKKSGISVNETIRDLYSVSGTYPRGAEIFKPFELTNFNNTKAVILGDAPLHNNTNNGLAWAVKNGRARPNSLKNIIIEVERQTDSRIPIDASDLTGWANQGVLLLNRSLTSSAASSHYDVWRPFIKELIKILADGEPKVFMLWGSVIQKEYKPLISYFKHAILEAGHPGVRDGVYFFNNNNFADANRILVDHFKKSPINWRNVDNRGETDVERFFDLGIE